MSLKQHLGLSEEPLYLIDGSAFVFRGFYAFRDMTRSDGFPTNALFVIMRMMLKILREEQPTHLAFFLDGKGKNFRNDLFPEYKAQRPPTPEDLVAQLAPIREGLQHMGVPVHVSDGNEADDCIASLAHRYKKQCPVIIVGADKDLKQCIDTNVWLWDPAGKSEKLTGLEDFREETGLEPSQWADYQALIGDSSDNIPGVPGIGPKSAMQIMDKFKTVEDVWDNLDDILPKFVKKLDGHRENALLYRQLTTLQIDSCIELTLQNMAYSGADYSRLRGFIQEYEFRSLLRELPAPPAGQEAPSKAVRVEEKAAGQHSLFSAPVEAPSPKGKPVHETSKLDSLPAPEMAEIGLTMEDKGVRIGMNGEEWAWQGDKQALDPWLGRASTVYVADIKSLYHEGLLKQLPLSQLFDISLAAYLLSPEERSYHLDKLMQRYQDDPDTAEFSTDDKGLATLAIGHALEKKLQAGKMTDLMADMEMPLISVLYSMEEIGFRIDREQFTAFLSEVNAKIEASSAQIFELAGQEFNIRSSQQLAEILFGSLGLKPKGKTPGGQPSTSSTVLEKLAGDHEIIDTILEFRALEKMRSTYLDPLPKLADQNDRIHTTFNQMATATGRLSSSSPNLQNIPIRGDMGKRMRACFTAAPGMKLVAADYSQIELRLLAHLSGDKALVSAFNDGADIHTRTAAILHNKDQSEITSDERRSAKTINFGLLYGMGPQRLSRELKITMATAKEFIERYFERMPAIRDLYQTIENEAKSNQSVTTLFGRRRLLPEINSRNNNQQALARRQAINTRVQGSAADIIKKAMIDVADNEELRSLDAKLILQVHDELVLEVPADKAEKAAEILEQVMSSVMELSVPLSVDTGIGENWAQAH